MLGDFGRKRKMKTDAASGKRTATLLSARILKFLSAVTFQMVLIAKHESRSTHASEQLGI